MRRLFTYLAALGLVLASLTIGVITADLPFWQRALQLPLTADALYLPVAEIGAEARALSRVAEARLAVDMAALESAVTRAQIEGSRALLVMRDGELVLARYFGADDEHTLMPAGVIARPVAAMMTGIAQSEQMFESLDTPVSRYLPEWADEERGRITLRQLLQDTSGLETGGNAPEMLRHPPWHAPAKLADFATSRAMRLIIGNDFARTALGFRLRHEPGGFYNVSPVNAQLLAVILERVTAVPYEHYVDLRLWTPAGGGRAQLALDRRAGMTTAHCCWRASAPAMMRIVGLLATDGMVGDRRILPEGWVEQMTRASRVSAESAMQLERVSFGGVEVLTATDGGHAFWVAPGKRLAILNIVNPEGTSSAHLAETLLRLLGSP
jgi:CubicO group peptidase (beta-lactamase class C family)